METILLLDTIKDKDNIIIILGATEQADLFDESIRYLLINIVEKKQNVVFIPEKESGVHIDARYEMPYREFSFHKMGGKQRLLLLQELLKVYTDQDNELTVKQIIDLFYQKYNVVIGRKAIIDDLKELEQSNLFDITINHKDGFEKYFSHQNRHFDISELRVLIDAISSAKFITKSETDKLVDKIKGLTSERLSIPLENRIVLSDSSKSNNPLVKYFINNLHSAISNANVINFQYGKYNVNKEFKLSRKGDLYPVRPYALVWNSDYYYLIGEYIPEKEIRHYRVDRMRKVGTTDEVFLPDPVFDITKYTGSLFHMYSGETSSIEIEFDNHLINVVIDRFGNKITVTPTSESSFRITTQAVVSDGLVRWLLSWGFNAKVMSPPSLIKRMKEESEKLYNHYH